MGKTLSEFLHGISSRELTLWIEYLRYEREQQGGETTNVNEFVQRLQT